MEYKCQICLQNLNLNDKLPMIARCGHTFCKKCSEKLQQRCPIDMKIKQVLVENLLVIDLIKQQNQTKISNKSQYQKKNDGNSIYKLSMIILLAIFLTISFIGGKDLNKFSNLLNVYHMISNGEYEDIKQLELQLQNKKNHNVTIQYTLKTKLLELKKRQQQLKIQLQRNKRVKNKIIKKWMKHLLIQEQNNKTAIVHYSNDIQNISQSKQLTTFNLDLLNQQCWYDKFLQFQKQRKAHLINATILVVGQMTQKQRYQKILVQFGVIVLIFLIFVSSSPLQCCNLFISTIISASLGFGLIQLIEPIQKML